MKKATLSEKKRSQAHGDNSTTQAPSKISRVLEYLVHGGSLNRFEAERIGEHCLHTTISALSNSHGLLFVRMPESVPNRWGADCRVVRYRLAPSHLARARKLLALFYSRQQGGNAA